MLIQQGANSTDDILKLNKGKRGYQYTGSEWVKDITPSLLKKNSANDSLKTETMPIAEKKQAKRFILTHLKDGIW